MDRTPPDTVPIFRSELQADLLYAVLTASAPMTMSELVAATGRPQPSLHREVTRLTDSGFFNVQVVGRSHLISANEDNPAISPLRSLVLVTMGPVELLRKELSGIPGIRDARIFGSWAARAAGTPGNSPADIDVLVVGEPDRAQVYAAASAVESVVKRDVNVTLVTEARWQTSDEPFLREVRSRPSIVLVHA